MPDDTRPPPRRKTNPYGVDLTGEARDRYVEKHEPLQLSSGAPRAPIEFESTSEHNIYEKYQRAKNHSDMLRTHASKLDVLEQGVTDLKLDAIRKGGQLDTIVSHTLKQTEMLLDSAKRRLDTQTELEAHRVKWWRSVWFKVLVTALSAVGTAVAVIAGRCG